MGIELRSSPTQLESFWIIYPALAGFFYGFYSLKIYLLKYMFYCEAGKEQKKKLWKFNMPTNTDFIVKCYSLALSICDLNNTKNTL